jgi:hypothetical protein
MRTGRTVGSNHRIRARLAAAGVVACVAALSVASVALGAAGRESASKKVTLHGQETKTITVGYPHALEFSGARYTCTWKIKGVDPGKVKILFHGSVNGGTACRVKAHNPARPSLDADVEFTVTATTISGGLG